MQKQNTENLKRKSLELQRTKKDLKDLKKYLDELYSFLPLAICSVNLARTVVKVNQAFSNLTGYSSAEIMGRNAEILFFDKKEANILKQSVFKKKEAQVKETTLLTNDKKKVSVRATVKLRKDRDDAAIGYFLAFLDISEVKQFQEELGKKVGKRTKELEDSRKALSNILEDVADAREKAEGEKNKTLAIIKNFSDGLLVFDEINTLSFVNPQAEKFFSVKSQDVVGKFVSDLNTLENFKPLIILLGQELRDFFRKEISLGKNLVLEVSAVPILRENKKSGTLVILHNITREKRIERMKTEFVSLTAHQLRTPLSAIKWTLQMFLTGDLGPINEEQKDFIEKTYKSNERMIALINDLLNITRIEEGRYLYKLMPVNMEEMIQDVIDSLKEEIQGKRINLRFRKADRKIDKIRVDAEKMSLVLQNLINNAIHYTPAGGEIIITLRQSNHDIEFSIKDTGIGIPKDQQNRVFSKFFRGANAIRTETEGTGLGLYIAKNIIEAHDGGIWFDSEENKGSTFYFVLPIKEEFKEFMKEF